MADSLIPDKDTDILANAVAFAGGIAANPGRYALAQADGESISRAVNEFKAAYDIAKNPETRTKGTITTKNQTLSAAVNIIRTYANAIRANHGVSDQAKIDIGIRPRKRDMTARKCPQSSPLLKFLGVTGGRHYLRFNDSNSPASRRKPFAATRLELFMMLIEPSEEAPASPAMTEAGLLAAHYLGSYTKNPIGVDVPHPSAPMLAVYFARWASHTGQVGPWSLALHTTLVGGRRIATSQIHGETSQTEAGLKLAA